MPALTHRAAALAVLVALLAPLVSLAVEPARPSPPACGEQLADRPPRAGFAAAVARNSPAVVQVVVIRGVRDPMEQAEGFEFFQPLAGLPLPGSIGDTLERTFSSGFVIDPAGYLLTSAHAVFDAHEIWVVMADGRRLRAAVTGLDRRTDVALLKVEASGLPTVRLAAPPRICPGAWLAALGTPFGFESTVTAGVVSAFPRYLPGTTMPLIQSDVALNPGSSGGPLFNVEGTVVGMSSMIYSASGIYIGVSFALPIDEVMRVVERLRSAGKARRGDIGLKTQAVDRDLALAFGLPDAAGAVVIRVDPDGAADSAGLRRGDIVLSVNAAQASDQSQIESAIAAAEPGSSLTLRVWRDQAAREVRVKVSLAPQDTPPPQRRRPQATQARLGLTFAPATVTSGMPSGVYVETASGAGLLAGLERGDRIAAVNGIGVQTAEEFDSALQALSTRPVVALLVMRGNVAVYVPVPR
jgi:serine protease Do